MGLVRPRMGEVRRPFDPTWTPLPRRRLADRHALDVRRASGASLRAVPAVSAAKAFVKCKPWARGVQVCKPRGGRDSTWKCAPGVACIGSVVGVAGTRLDERLPRSDPGRLLRSVLLSWMLFLGDDGGIGGGGLPGGSGDARRGIGWYNGRVKRIGGDVKWLMVVMVGVAVWVWGTVVKPPTALPTSSLIAGTVWHGHAHTRPRNGPYSAADARKPVDWGSLSIGFVRLGMTKREAWEAIDSSRNEDTQAIEADAWVLDGDCRVGSVRFDSRGRVQAIFGTRVEDGCHAWDANESFERLTADLGRPDGQKEGSVLTWKRGLWMLSAVGNQRRATHFTLSLTSPSDGNSPASNHRSP